MTTKYIKPMTLKQRRDVRTMLERSKVYSCPICNTKVFTRDADNDWCWCDNATCRQKWSHHYLLTLLALLDAGMLTGQEPFYPPKTLPIVNQDIFG